MNAGLCSRIATLPDLQVIEPEIAYRLREAQPWRRWRLRMQLRLGSRKISELQDTSAIE